MTDFGLWTSAHLAPFLSKVTQNTTYVLAYTLLYTPIDHIIYTQHPLPIIQRKSPFHG